MVRGCRKAGLSELCSCEAAGQVGGMQGHGMGYDASLTHATRRALLLTSTKSWIASMVTRGGLPEAGPLLTVRMWKSVHSPHV